MKWWTWLLLAGLAVAAGLGASLPNETFQASSELKLCEEMLREGKATLSECDRLYRDMKNDQQK
jgi:hypothetical protein